jgi:hypothetical protein
MNMMFQRVVQVQEEIRQQDITTLPLTNKMMIISMTTLMP